MGISEYLHELGHRGKNLLIRARTRYLEQNAWRKRHAKVRKLHPRYGDKCPEEVEEEHRRLWRQLRWRVKPDTLRVCHGISGKADPRLVPEEIYATEIEPALNRYETAWFQGNKSTYSRWWDSDLFPRCFLHNIDGKFYDQNYRPMEREDTDRLIEDLPFPVVVKASIGPHGGRAVSFPENIEQLREQIRGRINYVVQRKLPQDPWFSRFNEVGLNTLRICTYRSVETERIHVLNMALRMGKGGSLDNETQGGIVCYVHEGGRLNDYAVDKYGEKFSEHPDTGIRFSDAGRLPAFEELKDLVTKVAQSIYLARVVSLDACMDSSGNWRFIEVNLGHQTIRFAQYAGFPFFGEFTDEVIEYCKNNPRWL